MQALTWQKMTQFYLIEVIVLWEGRLTTNHLQNAYSISRSNASKIINEYKLLHPENLVMSMSEKGYVPSDKFQHYYSKGNAQEYLHLISSNSLLHEYFTEHVAKAAPAIQIVTHQRELSPLVVRPIVRACRERLRLEVCYYSASCPHGEERIISPHTLVLANHRWHVRAFCEKHRDFRDFVLNRFNEDIEVIGEALAPACADLDHLWQNEVEIILRPNPGLSKAQQALVALDYGMTNDSIILPTKQALVHYTLLDFHIFMDAASPISAEAQPLVVENPEVLAPFLF